MNIFQGVIYLSLCKRYGRENAFAFSGVESNSASLFHHRRRVLFVRIREGNDTVYFCSAHCPLNTYFREDNETDS